MINRCELKTYMNLNDMFGQCLSFSLPSIKRVIDIVSVNFNNVIVIVNFMAIFIFIVTFMVIWFIFKIAIVINTLCYDIPENLSYPPEAPAASSAYIPVAGTFHI